MAEYESIGSADLDASHVFVPTFTGLLIGYAIAKSGTYLPSVIIGSFSFKNFLLPKVLLSALCASLLLQSFLSLLNSNRFAWSRRGHGRGVLYSLLGGYMLGAGVAICQSDPFLAWVQAGCGIMTAVYVAAGALAAVVVFGFVADRLCSDPITVRQRYIDEAANNVDYWIIAVPMAVLAAVGCALLETEVRPWTREVPNRFRKPDSPWIPDPRYSFWAPYAAGLAIGLCQLPLRTILGKTVTGYCSYVSPVSIVMYQLFDRILNCRIPPFFRATSGAQGLWTVFLAIGAACGGIIASETTGTMASESGIGPAWTIVGSFVMMIGALLCGGDVIAIVVSGCSDLHVLSYVAAAAVFAGGYSLPCILNALKLKPQ